MHYIIIQSFFVLLLYKIRIKRNEDLKIKQHPRYDKLLISSIRKKKTLNRKATFLSEYFIPSIITILFEY